MKIKGELPLPLAKGEMYHYAFGNVDKHTFQCYTDHINVYYYFMLNILVALIQEL